MAPVHFQYRPPCFSLSVLKGVAVSGWEQCALVVPSPSTELPSALPAGTEGAGLRSMCSC